MLGSSEIIIIFVFMFLIPAIVIAYLLRKHLNIRRTNSYERNALNIAKERYAKGEITKEEFEEIRKNII